MAKAQISIQVSLTSMPSLLPTCWVTQDKVYFKANYSFLFSIIFFICQLQLTHNIILISGVQHNYHIYATYEGITQKNLASTWHHTCLLQYTDYILYAVFYNPREYFVTTHLHCLIPSPFSSIPPSLTPIWQPSKRPLYLWVCFHLFVYFVF